MRCHACKVEADLSFFVCVCAFVFFLKCLEVGHASRCIFRVEREPSAGDVHAQAVAAALVFVSQFYDF